MRARLVKTGLTYLAWAAIGACSTSTYYMRSEAVEQRARQAERAAPVEMGMEGGLALSAFMVAQEPDVLRLQFTNGQGCVVVAIPIAAAETFVRGIESVVRRARGEPT